MTTTTQSDPPGDLSGVAVLDKPAGWTSHQVVGRIRRVAGTRKVGHAGTLDPMATGVLVVGIGRATRLLGYLSGTTKEYTATIRLGQSTVTDDAEGEVVAAAGAQPLSASTLEAALAPLRGDIIQVPSAVSAVKVGGVRSYARVRAGEHVELAGRPVHVSRLECVALSPTVVDGLPVVDLEVIVECSSGTYVRALARDLGLSLGTGGHLTALRRTRVGPFGIESAQPLEAATEALALTDIDEVAALAFPTSRVDDEQRAWVLNGRRLPGVALPASPTALLDRNGHFLALYRQAGPDAVAEAVFGLAGQPLRPPDVKEHRA
jgi:tRNA pseudouridine55 synthase